TGIDRVHARRCGGGGCGDRFDPRMRVRRPQKYRMELPRQVGVVLIPASTREQLGVLEPGHRLANAELHHCLAPGCVQLPVLRRLERGTRPKERKSIAPGIYARLAAYK